MASAHALPNGSNGTATGRSDGTRQAQGPRYYVSFQQHSRQRSLNIDGFHIFIYIRLLFTNIKAIIL